VLQCVECANRLVTIYGQLVLMWANEMCCSKQRLTTRDMVRSYVPECQNHTCCDKHRLTTCDMICAI